MFREYLQYFAGKVSVGGRYSYKLTEVSDAADSIFCSLGKYQLSCH